MGVPISILIDKSADGRFHATAPDNPGLEAEAETLDQLFDSIKQQLAPILSTRSASAESTDATNESEDEGFDDDLGYVLEKNAELYRRLAQ
jgi:predicted RNase H-like HicB family nuclease